MSATNRPWPQIVVSISLGILISLSLQAQRSDLILRSDAQLLKTKHASSVSIDQKVVNDIFKSQPKEVNVELAGLASPILLQRDKSMSEFVSVRTSSGKELRVKSGLHYKSIDQKDQAFCRLSFFENGMNGIVQLDREFYSLSKSDTGNEYKLIRENFDNKQWCSVESASIPNSNEKFTDEVNKSNLVNTCVGVYVECDHQTYIDRGSNIQATVDFTNAIFASVIGIYETINIDLYITEIFVWDTQDPYDLNDTSWSNRLTEFRDNVQTFNGDIAHLIHRNANGCLSGGRAYENILCSTYAHGVSLLHCGGWADYPTYNYPVAIVAHEIGHNLGGSHTHNCVWNGDNTAIDLCGGNLGCNGANTQSNLVPATLMSYCWPSTPIDFTDPFHPQQITRINDYLTPITCLSTCLPDCSQNGGNVDEDQYCADVDCDDNDPSLPGTPGSPCDDGDICTTNDVLDITGCICAGTNNDSDADGVCDGLDICPGGDDNVDSDTDGTPDFCDCDPMNALVSELDECGVCGGTGINANSFPANPLTQTGPGYGITTITFSQLQENPIFHIYDINNLLTGPVPNRYIEEVSIEYVDQNGNNIFYNSYANVSSVEVAIEDIVESITVSLTDQYDNDSGNSTMQVTFSDISSCDFGTPPPANCPQSLQFSMVLPDGTHHAEISITSDGQVGSGSIVHLKAGTQICLDPGFEASLGADLEITIEACPQ